MRPTTEPNWPRACAPPTARLRCVGGGTRRSGPAVGRGAVDRRASAGITLYEPGALTLVARAGTPLAEVEAALAAEGQRLAFEPMDHRVRFWAREGEPTIGGWWRPMSLARGGCRWGPAATA
jgi:glycolate oxidase FAD binding subunit